MTGVVLARLEQRGLVVEAMRVSKNETEIIEDHYPRSQEWLTAVGDKTLADYAKLGISTRRDLARISRPRPRAAHEPVVAAPR